MLIIISVAVCSFLIFSLIHYLGKNKKPCKRALISVLTGPVLLLIVNLISSLTGVIIPLSQLSFAVSTALGIPGVSLLVVMTVLV